VEAATDANKDVRNAMNNVLSAAAVEIVALIAVYIR
jgi:hypothetical protein